MSIAHIQAVGTSLWARVLHRTVKFNKSALFCEPQLQLTTIDVFCFVLQIKFEHFSSGFTDAVRRNHNASKRTGHGGCLRAPSHHGNTTQHASHGLRRRRRKTSATANLQQPRFVTAKVRSRGWQRPAGEGGGRARGSDEAPRDAKRRCCIALSPAADERPCNEFISQITVFRL